MQLAQPVLVQPNLINLTGYETAITLSGSITGIPEFTYTNRGETLVAKGEEILSETTQLGELVTVNLAKNPQSIGEVETISVFIPSIVKSAGDTNGVPIQTVALLSLRSPRLDQSPIYMPLCLSGTAQMVFF